MWQYPSFIVRSTAMRSSRGCRQPLAWRSCHAYHRQASGSAGRGRHDAECHGSAGWTMVRRSAGPTSRGAMSAVGRPVIWCDLPRGTMKRAVSLRASQGKDQGVPPIGELVIDIPSRMHRPWYRQHHREEEPVRSGRSVDRQSVVGTRRGRRSIRQSMRGASHRAIDPTEERLRDGAYLASAWISHDGSNRWIDPSPITNQNMPWRRRESEHTDDRLARWRRRG
jgi:hypothetical protein